jgi:hypothetical protein
MVIKLMKLEHSLYKQKSCWHFSIHQGRNHREHTYVAVVYTLYTTGSSIPMA